MSDKLTISFDTETILGLVVDKAINNEEFIIALSGSFDVVVDDGFEKKVFQMNRSYYGLYIPKGMWREINNFSSNSFALEFGSTEYDENDYIRDYDTFLKMKQDGKI